MVGRLEIQVRRLRRGCASSSLRIQLAGIQANQKNTPIEILRRTGSPLARKDIMRSG